MRHAIPSLELEVQTFDALAVARQNSDLDHSDPHDFLAHTAFRKLASGDQCARKCITSIGTAHRTSQSPAYQSGVWNRQAAILESTRPVRTVSRCETESMR